jgi:hypothetical protein
MMTPPRQCRPLNISFTGKKLLIFFCLVVAAASGSPAGASDSRDLVRFGSDLMIEEGMEVRNAVVIAGDVVVDGRVDQDVVAIGGSVILTDKASVGRNVVAVSGSIERGTGAEVGGNMTEVNIPGLYSLVNAFSGGNWTGPFIFFAVWPIISFIGFLALALLIAVIFPGSLAAVSGSIEINPIKSAVAGFVGMLLIIPLGVLLAVSIIGLVLIPVEIILVSTAFLFGYVAAAAAIGRKLYAAMKRPRTLPFWETLFGMVFLGVIGLIPVLGWLINSLAAIFGFGGIWLAVVRKRRAAV